ncbi:precorrin-3B synthase [Caballeronia novacaledonica]|uniref:Precorrin-3B synthase n=1 Tax=Caballeronia novacaledonica TaxID=1544861 RepID=A0A2U3I008_9BURK|nr:precorrin-3B synthase [Caballeronia novacaledonica]SPB13396.1 precorrin-3B synthase [Caballeronia novacaledonica]
MREAQRVTLLTSFDRSSLTAAPRASACPGLMRIVPARDGGLARLRLAGGVLSAHAARAVVRAARVCGTGVIEVTNRANLQLRGIRDDAHAALIDIALDAGLGPSTAGGDDLRNVMLSPLASADTRALAARIIDAMQADASLHALSPKFALQLDAGERLAMLEHPHDVWLSAIDDGARFAFGFAGTMRQGSSGAIDRGDVVPFVSSVLRRFLALAAPEEHRMRDLLARIGIARFVEAFDFDASIQHWRRESADASLRLGAHAEPYRATWYAGAQTPLGRLDATTLEALADIADTHAECLLAMTPWQSVLIPGIAAQDAHDVLQRLHALGLATDAREPLARLIACAGSEGCAKSRADTKADAHRLAALLPAHDESAVHLSGCERSCAAAHPVPVTLYAVAPGRYDFHRGARTVARDLTIEEAAERLARSHADA